MVQIIDIWSLHVSSTDQVEASREVVVRRKADVYARRVAYRIAKDHLLEAIAELRAVCDHSEVVEAPYVPEGVFFNAFPPLRLCIFCGVEEEGWSAYEFKHLHNPTRKVSRETLYSLRLPVGGRVLLCGGK